MPKTFHELCAEVKNNIIECSVEDVEKMIDDKENFFLIDIREESEFEHSHIEGSIHVGKGILERDIHLHIPDHDSKIILYCGGGFRSVLAAESIQKMGYSNVFSMAGGWKAWKKKNG